MDTLGDRIRIARGNASQAAFSKALDISKGSLGFYERNENLPNSDVVIKICSLTGVTLEWLLLGAGPMKAKSSPDNCSDAQISAETANLISNMGRKLSHVEAGLSANRALLNGENATCSHCLELYKKIDQANERLYQASERERDLLKENSDLRAEILLLKNGQSGSNSGKSIQTA